MEEIDEKEKSKLQSRKFRVWLTWLIIAVIVIAFCIISMIVTKSVLDSMTSLIEKTLGWFFYISICYITVNGAQKIGYSISDALNKREGEGE